MSVTVKERLGNGIHWRLLTANGVVHVWIPDTGAGEGTAVYVHGYYDNADQAWAKYNLPGQFAASGRQMAFVVPEAPIGASSGVNWTNLDQLLDTVAADTGVGMPNPITVIGHSGAYRTILPWLPNPRIKHITLLDALYAGVPSFIAWGAQAGHTLDIVVTPGGEPKANADAALAKGAVGLVRRAQLPLDPAAVGAKLVYLTSPLSHMALVTPPMSIIPELLRRAPARSGALLAIVAVALVAGTLYLIRRS